VDGTQLRTLGSAALKSRARMIHNGAAVATLVLDRQGRLAAPPQVTVHGVMEEDEAALAALAAAVGEAVGDLEPTARRDDEAVREAARLAVRRSLRASHGKRPVTDVHIVRI